jgi:hypothetical protein
MGQNNKAAKTSISEMLEEKEQESVVRDENQGE